MFTHQPWDKIYDTLAGSLLWLLVSPQHLLCCVHMHIQSMRKVLVCDHLKKQDWDFPKVAFWMVIADVWIGYLIFLENPTIQVFHIHLFAFYLLHVFLQCSKDVLQEWKSVWFKPFLHFSKLLTGYRRAIFTEINLSIHPAASPR